MSDIKKAKISVEKILDCKTLVECQEFLQEILNDSGFHNQPKELIGNENYIQLINYIDDLMKIVISAPSIETIDELTSLLQDTQTDIYTYIDNIVYDDTSYENIEDYITGDYADFHTFFLEKLIKEYLYYNIVEYIDRI